MRIPAQDLRLALAWYDKAAAQGDAEAAKRRDAVLRTRLDACLALLSTDVGGAVRA